VIVEKSASPDETFAVDDGIYVRRKGHEEVEGEG
jgi:hypothetical protein